MNDYIKVLRVEFEAHSDSKIAAEQKAYLRDQFLFYGIKTPIRRSIQKPFLAKEYLPVKENLDGLIRLLWNRPQREYHYFAQELAQKYVKQFEKRDIQLFEFMVTTNSWWDTVDFIAPKLISEYFKKFPEQRDPYIEKWLASNNIWLQRSCLIFQLLSKDNMDTELLARVINSLLGSKEFFINKAIGWALRDYSRTNPAWVSDFATKTPLEPLSKREALRLLQ
ncbi:DNA alkylation repair protein [Maribacter algicola]|uniref:DNA alkylation repair protein n=1 Tax=Meishania litoralis TaxID=3434685 RepID=A0ACC7LJG4_9FLAO